MIVRKFSRVTPSEAPSSGTECRQKHTGRQSHHLRRLLRFIQLHPSHRMVKNDAIGTGIGGVRLNLRSFITRPRGRCSRTVVNAQGFAHGCARTHARGRTHAHVRSRTPRTSKGQSAQVRTQLLHARVQGCTRTPRTLEGQNPSVMSSSVRCLSLGLLSIRPPRSCRECDPCPTQREAPTMPSRTKSSIGLDHPFSELISGNVSSSRSGSLFLAAVARSF